MPTPRKALSLTPAALLAALAGTAMGQSALPFPAQFELSSLLPANGGNGSNGFVLNGIDAYDNAGNSVSSAGDVNGDGIDDLIIGAYNSSPNGNFIAGESYVVFGAVGLGLGGVIEPSSLNGSNGFVINGIDLGDFSGGPVSSAGDVNGDGIDDLVIGAFGGDPNGSSVAGESYVVFGGVGVGSGGVLNLSSLNGSNGFVLNGIDPNDRSGRVSSAGDVNGDGIDDLVIGARDADPNGIDRAGESYVVFGAIGVGSGGVIELSSLNGTNGFVLNGIDAIDHSGFSVSSAGDVNGDGFDDLIIGAYTADSNGLNNAGESYVVFGALGLGTGGVIELSSLNGTNGFVLNGVDANDISGTSVSSAGDVNGDGIDDLVIGAISADQIGNPDAGESYVVFGAIGLGSGGVIELSSLNGTNGFVLNGIDTDDRSGWSVSSAGDVNDDGIDDVIIGASWADPNGNSYAGESYVVFGAVGVGAGGVIELSSLNGTDGFILNGIDADDYSGRRVSSAGDVNGDGVDDLIIGAKDADPNGNTDAGESYVVFGRANIQSWISPTGGNWDTGANWFNGTSPIVGSVEIDTPTGVTVTGPAGAVFLDTLVLRAGTGQTILDLDRFSVVSMANAFDLASSAAITGDGILIFERAMTVEGLLSMNGMTVFADSGLTNDILGDIVIAGAASLETTGVQNAGTMSIGPTATATVTGPVSNSAIPNPATAIGISGVFELSSLNGTNGFVLNGIDASDLSGHSVSSAGDVNGDGIDDLIIGAYDADPYGNSAAGEGYVVFGGVGVGASGVIELSSLNGTNGFVLNGIDADDNSSWSVSSAGDVNGDEIDDLVIGAIDADPNGNSNAGESYVLFGAAGVGSGGEINLSSLNGTNGFVINGIVASDRSGRSVSSAGDVNDDGIDDLIIGATGADPNGNSIAGASYVVFGAVGLGSGGEINLSSLNGTNGLVLNGIDTSDTSGRSVSSAGDVNGDGIDDLIIGASGADPNGNSAAGESYVVFGAVGLGSGGVIELSSLNGANGFVLNGIGPLDNSGFSVSSAGDVNGDGIDDLLIGANGADSNGNNVAGGSYVVFGAVGVGSGGVIELSSLNGTNGFVLNGIDANDRSGWSASSAGDVNDDGIEDLVIGAHSADPNGNVQAGESYIVFGGIGVGAGGVINLSSLNGTNGFVLNGIDTYDYSGRSVSSAGDVNGDGVDDLIIGARSADPYGNADAGESYVVFGNPGDPSPALISISGASIATFGDDVTNDNVVELSDDSALTIGGTLTGNGISGPGGGGTGGSVIVLGGIIPVAANSFAGITQFDGDVQLGSAGTTIIEIGGTTPGVDLDQIASTGQLDAGGTLIVDVLPGFMPSPGDEYQVLSFGSSTGSFSSVILDQALIDAGADTSNLLTTGLIVIPGFCAGDANMDGIVNFADITSVLGNWLTDGLAGGDANGDDLVNFGDITAVLGNWLSVCP